MTSSGSYQKRTKRDSYKEFSGFQLFYQLAYMSAVAAAGLSRHRIFALASELSTTVAHYFAEVENLVQSFHYDYPRACRVIGERAKENEVRSFLFRLSDALESGEPLDIFLAREAEAQGESYSNEYERDLESLKKWTDAYASLIVSQVLIVIINLISTMIYDIGTKLVAGFMVMSVLFSFLGAWILSRAAPREVMTLPGPEGSKEQILARKLLLIAFPLTVIVGGGLYLLDVDWPWILILSAALLFPVGIMSLVSDRKLNRKEGEFGPFLRSLGGMASSTATTLTESLLHIDLKSFPALEPDATRLGMRLRARIDKQICWRRFGTETGSQLITEGVRIFYDAITVGGDPEEVSSLCSMFTTKTSLLRAKRRGVSSTFNWLTIVMHGALSVLLLLVLNIVISFRTIMQDVISPNLTAEAAETLEIPLLSYNTGQMAFLKEMTIGMLFLLIVVNSIAIVASDGGFKHKICFYAPLLMVVSSVSFFVVPPIVRSVMLQSISS
ncbi:MAG: hypothetical protein U9R48_06975 [Chloroflexota bacterium]|nr:hypothetical protein [Chloroflexota bacterium]